MFTIRIPVGKLVGMYFITISFKRYLDIAPKNPPRPINKIFIIILEPQI